LLNTGGCFGLRGSVDERLSGADFACGDHQVIESLPTSTAVSIQTPGFEETWVALLPALFQVLNASAAYYGNCSTTGYWKHDDAGFEKAERTAHQKPRNAGRFPSNGP
jgi:hypothetical protein